jgi:hypothetical protein
MSSAISLQMTVRGSEDAIRATGRDIDKLEQELAYRIVDESRTLMDSSVPSGRVYRRGGFRRGQSRGLNAGPGRRARGAGSRFHRASAPGQPPAEDSGRLYRDINVRRLSTGRYRVRFGAGYAGYLEFGTGRMRARPFVLPAIETAVQKTFGVSAE